ncbi:MAG TPA: hypothetical protein DD723_09820 [Candidatus Omnitrophica bacterium]|nr:MAG: hypothetical protein A2Z81_06295 [Omnitrophica WOR_2 bacterium GWA2_45_18]OGX19448.1 MAG: hypothetical protein A2Y04_01335 [Omnitrophica WOR_2 bacterium GWC2_45_7]HBR15816.1 hypothetical protein [Candidatus Omnitrophota bacterium]
MRTTGPGQSTLLLIDVIETLNRCHIPYAIIGAFAVSFYGIVRASLDADAVISVAGNKNHLQGLLSELEQRHLKIVYRRGDQEDPIEGVINIQDDFYNRVDLLIGIRGMTKDVFQRVVEAEFKGTSIKFISLEDFVAMKVFAGGNKDIQDVIGVLQVSRERLNLGLLKELTLNYGKDELKKLENLLKEYYSD